MLFRQKNYVGEEFSETLFDQHAALSVFELNQKIVPLGAMGAEILAFKQNFLPDLMKSAKKLKAKQNLGSKVLSARLTNVLNLLNTSLTACLC